MTQMGFSDLFILFVFLHFHTPTCVWKYSTGHTRTNLHSWRSDLSEHTFDKESRQGQQAWDTNEWLRGESENGRHLGINQCLCVVSSGTHSFYWSINCRPRALQHGCCCLLLSDPPFVFLPSVTPIFHLSPSHVFYNYFNSFNTSLLSIFSFWMSPLNVSMTVDTNDASIFKRICSIINTNALNMLKPFIQKKLDS